MLRDILTCYSVKLSCWKSRDYFTQSSCHFTQHSCIMGRLSRTLSHRLLGEMKHNVTQRKVGLHQEGWRCFNRKNKDNQQWRHTSWLRSKWKVTVSCWVLQIWDRRPKDGTNTVDKSSNDGNLFRIISQHWQAWRKPSQNKKQRDNYPTFKRSLITGSVLYLGCWIIIYTICNKNTTISHRWHKSSISLNIIVGCFYFAALI